MPLAHILRPNGRRFPEPVEPKLIRDPADGAPPRVERERVHFGTPLPTNPDTRRNG